MGDELRNEIYKIVQECLHEQNFYEPKRYKTLIETYQKWYKGINNKNDGALLNILGGPNSTSWKTWDYIRLLTLAIVGAPNIKYVKNIDQAEDVANKLCQFVYDLVKEVRLESGADK